MLIKVNTEAKFQGLQFSPKNFSCLSLQNSEILRFLFTKKLF